MAKKSKRVGRSIVVGHLEKISSGIFDQANTGRTGRDDGT